MQVDHHARADRLRDAIESWTKVNEDCLDRADIDLDGEIPHVPHRYAASEWDGSSTWINFADTIEEANAISGDLGGEYPWAPGEMIDLDTGVPYEPKVTVEYEAQRWLVHASPDDSDLVFNVRFTSEEKAREYIEAHKDPESGMTALDSEPIDELARDE
jgi:hypothetical protein